MTFKSQLAVAGVTRAVGCRGAAFRSSKVDRWRALAAAGIGRVPADLRVLSPSCWPWSIASKIAVFAHNLGPTERYVIA